MEQNRKKIRIQKVVLSLLSVIFLAMALAGISAMYLNGGYGRGISWVYEETYEDSDTFSMKIFLHISAIRISLKQTDSWI